MRTWGMHSYSEILSDLPYMQAKAYENANVEDGRDILRVTGLSVHAHRPTVELQESHTSTTTMSPRSLSSLRDVSDPEATMARDSISPSRTAPPLLRPTTGDSELKPEVI